jgi:hypothetical protein
MLTIGHVLLVIGVTVGYSLLALARPSGTCWRCGGRGRTGIVKRDGKVVSPGEQCRVCRGTGWAVTPGAPAVHALLHELAGERIRARLRERGQRK